MGINDILHKNNPIQKKIDRENRSDFSKLVDRNTELVDEVKWLKADNEILKNRIDSALAYIDTCIGLETKEELRNILKGENYD